MNIDPAGVKALLERLGASQAWQDVVNTVPPTPAAPATSTQPSVHTPRPASSSSPETPSSSPSPSVAALLSQLNSVPPVRVPPVPQPVPPAVPVASAPTVPPTPAQFATFQQALPRLAQLTDDPAVVSAIAKLKQEQDKVERDLWAERTAIRIKYEDKVKVAKTKATLIGVGLSKHEAEMLVQAYEKELKRFDAERVLPAWDGLVTKQQATLAQLGIPTMFQTTVKADRERQQRVIQVLEGVVSTESSEMVV